VTPVEPEPQNLDGRTAAVLAVGDALIGRRFASEALRALRAAGRIAGREAPLAMEIAQGAVRHLVTIEHVLASVARFDRHRTPARLRAVLYTAAYQIIWMDRIPPFAAADQAVELARRLVRGRAPGMVNAILRRLTGALTDRGTDWERLNPTHVRVDWTRAAVFDRAVLPDTEAAYLPAAAGESARRWAALCEQYGAAQAEAVAWASQAVPVTVLQRNPRRATVEAFRSQLQHACGKHAAVTDDMAFVAPTVAVMDLDVFQEGLVYVQDGTARLAAGAVDAQPGERVLDLCAAPGGKTVALALAMNDRGAVVACDTEANRLGRVDANVMRLGLSCVHTRLLSKEDAGPVAGSQPIDAALVDVPCSNTGVIARRPEARLGLTRKKLDALRHVQHALIRRAAEPVRPGGRLVYSTCSIEPEENEGVVAAFVKEHADWRIDVQQTTLPAWGPAWSDWRDGGYFARLVRMGG
jgi:16S rRNA (cytosine967-C5)-methyltransferase